MFAMSPAAGATGQFADLTVPAWAWVALVGVIVVLLVADLLIVHRTAHVITMREAAIESGVWIALGLSFTLVMLWWQGGGAAGEYLSAYLIEKSLSVDNVFVWAVIFSYFAVPAKYQFRVLFWGVFGALVLRAVFIFAGVALIERFDWLLYVFGAFLLFTAVRIARSHGSSVNPDNVVLRLVRRVVPSTDTYDGQKLFTVRDGVRLATPLFAVLLLIESTDVLFAVDSIPAVLSVSREQFTVFASNAFAILGLRALYFCLAGMAGKFRYLDKGLAVILAFVGVKMLVVHWVHVPVGLSLAVIAVTLVVAILASQRADRRQATEGPDLGHEDLAGDDPAGDDPAPAPATSPTANA